MVNKCEMSINSIHLWQFSHKVQHLDKKYAIHTQITFLMIRSQDKIKIKDTIEIE